MGRLAKVKLQDITSNRGAISTRSEVEAQFNPTSMRLAHSNSVEGGRQRAQQTRQYLGQGSSVLTVSLVFDTADEGNSDNPRSVREKVNFLEKFVLPIDNGGRQIVPKLRFHWGTFVFDGIVERLNLEFDLFASNGTPLRAKVDLSIKEQDAKFERLESGQGANRAGNSTDPGDTGSSSAAPGASDESQGSQAAAESNRVAPAMEGETAPEFASRMGLDPTAWRGLSADLSAGMSLEAGVEIGFDAGLSLNAGMGISLGVEAGVDLSLDATFGLTTELSATAGVGGSFGGGANAKLSAGFALAASGGLSAAMESVKQINAETAANASMTGFTAHGSQMENVLNAKPLPPRAPSRPVQERTPMASKISDVNPGAARAYAPVPALPVADPRSSSFGQGVPLRRRFQPPEADRFDVRAKLRGSAPGQVLTTDPTVPGWVRLQKRQPGRTADDGKRTTRTCYSCICGPVPKKR